MRVLIQVLKKETTPDNSRSVRNIYIGDQDYLDSLENIGYNDVLVLDLRDDENDPDVKVYNSYRIKDSISMKKVIDTIMQYEIEHPSGWERTFDSMMYEWAVHNFAYDFHYDRTRSKDVDFNNKDEMKYVKDLSKQQKRNTY